MYSTLKIFLTLGIYDYIPSAIEDVGVVFVVMDVANVLAIVVVVTGVVVISAIDGLTIVDFDEVAVVVVVFIGKFDVDLQFSSFFEIRCSMSISIWLEFRCEGKGFLRGLNFISYARLNSLFHITVELMSHPCKFAKFTQKLLLT